MAIRFACGADLFGSASNIGRKWTIANTITLAAGRFGGSALRVGEVPSLLTKTIGGTEATIGVAFALFVVIQNTSSAVRILLLTDTGTCQVGLAINAAQQLVIFRDSLSNVLATSSASLSAGVWHHLEVKATINNATGSVEVRKDGSTTPFVSVSGVDTQTSGNAFVNEIRFTTDTNNTPDFDVDDVVIWDTTGSAPQNNFLGDVRIQTLQPTGAGNSTGMTVTGAASNFQAVDDTTPNDDTDYVSAASGSGAKDTYATSNLSGTVATIYGVQSNLLARKTDAGTADAVHVVRTGGTDFDSAAQGPTTTYSYLTDLRTVNPNTTVAWTQADVDGAEFGQKAV